jgi:hypothetical protein
VENNRLKQYRWTTGTLPGRANFPDFGENTKIDATLLRNKLDDNHKKQAKLTDAYLENLLGEDVYRDKMETLRGEEDGLKKFLAGYELREIESERSEGYLNRIKDFLEGYDDGLTKVSFEQKRQMAGLLFKNIKIAPAIGGARPQKRIAFSLFAPFNFLFSESERKSQCQKNQIVTKFRRKKSTSVPSDDPWVIFYKSLKPFLFSVFQFELLS